MFERFSALHIKESPKFGVTSKMDLRSVASESAISSETSVTDTAERVWYIDTGCIMMTLSHAQLTLIYIWTLRIRPHSAEKKKRTIIVLCFVS